MKKFSLSSYITGFISATILAGVVVGASYLYSAKDIEFNSSNDSWNVTNVEEALKDLKNNYKSNDDIMNILEEFNGVEWNFSFKDSKQVFNVPIEGTYKIELWGASGGGYDASNAGGYGGYSVGYIHLDKSKPLYIYTGGAGRYVGPNAAATGGYNGGGAIVATWSDGNEKRSTGGGATHVAFKEGLLYELVNDSNQVVMVAGGGGATQVNSAILSVAWGHGGHGGGYIGGTGTGVSYSDSFYATGGTQDAGGTTNSDSTVGLFGRSSISTNGNRSGGGGGWYGGASSLRGAGGGSGYIGYKDLKDAVMYCYNCDTSTKKEIRTETNTCVNSEAKENCSKTGNGYAKITLINLN